MKHLPVIFALLALIVGWFGYRQVVDGRFEVQIWSPIRDSAQKSLDADKRRAAEDEGWTEAAGLAAQNFDQAQSEVRHYQITEGVGVILLGVSAALLIGSVTLYRRRVIPQKPPNTDHQNLKLSDSEVGVHPANDGNLKSNVDRAWPLIPLFLVIFVFVVAFALLNFSSTQPVAPTETSSPEIPAHVTASATGPDKPHWDYHSFTVKAGSETVKAGCLQSEEMVHLESPYHDTHTELCFRSNNSVILILDGKGQILSGGYYRAVVRVNNGAPQSYELLEPDDRSSDAVFLTPAAPLIAAAKSGKQILVEVTYYESGSQTSTFIPPAPLVLK